MAYRNDALDAAKVNANGRVGQTGEQIGGVCTRVCARCQAHLDHFLAR